MALTTEQIDRLIQQADGLAAKDGSIFRALVKLTEAEVRKQDAALIRQMMEALKQFQYRACESIHPDFVDEAVTAARARLGEKT